jgi:hypothetical protein
MSINAYSKNTISLWSLSYIRTTRTILARKGKKMRLAVLQSSPETRVVNETTQPIPNQPSQDPKTVNLRSQLTTNQPYVAGQIPQDFDAGSDTQAYSPQANSGASATHKDGLGDWAAVQKMRDDHTQNLPLEKKLDMAIKQSKTAQSFAAQALRSVDGFDKKLDQVFKSLSAQIQRVAQGQSAEPHAPGSSIWDEHGDPESIFGV